MTYAYRVAAVSTRNVEPPQNVLEIKTETPIDETPPSPPGALTAQPGPYDGAVSLEWSPIYAPDLRDIDPYKVYKDGVLVTVQPALLPGNDAFLLNFTAETGAGTILDWTNVKPSTLWDSAVGWGWLAADPNGTLTGEDSNTIGVSEQEGSSILVSNDARTFRIQGTADAVYLVDVGIGHPANGSSNRMTVNGTYYWNYWSLQGGDWRHMERAIQADSSGYLDVLIDAGVYVTYMHIRETAPDPSPTRALVDGIASGTSGSYTVKAVDDDGNPSVDSPAAVAAAWSDPAQTYEIWVTDKSTNTATEDFVHKIWEWGYGRFGSASDDPQVMQFLKASTNTPEYGQPIVFRAAGLKIDFRQVPGNGTCPGVVIYRQGASSLDWKKLTPQPIEGDPSDLNNPCDLVYYDKEVSALEHTYWVSQVISGSTERLPKPVAYEYAYKDDPSVVMGQYAYGATLLSDDNLNPEDGGIFISPAGTWELGNLPPLSPVYLKWQPSYDPSVVGYHVWVNDAFRSQGDWKVMATINDPTTTNYVDEDAPFNWPALLVPNSMLVDHSKCRVHGAPLDDNYNTPCLMTADRLSYFAHYLVQGFTDPTALPVAPSGVATGNAWRDAVRAVRIGSGSCPDAANFCTTCAEGCIENAAWCSVGLGCDGSSSPCCRFPDTYPAEDLLRVNFIQDSAPVAVAFPGYERATEATGYPSTGGVEQTRLLGWQSTSGLAGRCTWSGDPTCVSWDNATGTDVMLYSSVCYSNSNPDTRTFRMNTGPGTFYVEVTGGDGNCENTTIAVNGSTQNYWDDEYQCGDSGETRETEVVADTEGFINLTIGRTDTTKPGSSCVTAVKVQAKGTTPPLLASTSPLQESDDRGYLLAEAPDVQNEESRTLMAAALPAPERPILGTLEIVAESAVQGRAPAPDRLVGQVAPGSTIEWLHADHLGSTRVVTDQNGEVISRHKYLPFGQEFTDAGVDQNNTHKYTGHERDEGTGLDYMMARYYSPETAFRFLSVDPAGESVEVGDPMTWNRYLYTNNNPVNSFDPDGRAVIVLTVAGAAAVVAAAAVLAAPNPQERTKSNAQVWGEAAIEGGKSAVDAIVDATVDAAFDATVNAALNWLSGSDDGGTGESEAGEESSGSYAPDRDLPRDENGKPIPDTENAHSQLGKRTSDNTGETYTQAREFNANGQRVRDVDFTNHGRADHPNPHQHEIDPATGKRGTPKPLDPQNN